MITFNITRRIFAVAVISMFTVAAVNAQTPNPINNAASPLPLVNSVPVPPPPGMGAPLQQQSPLQEIASFAGSFVKMIYNDDYVYDGFYLLNNGDSLLVKFPPHLGKQITDVAKNGESVTVNGTLKVNPVNVKEVRMYSVKAGHHAEVTDTMSAIPATPPTETYISANGKITQLQTNKEGVINGLIIDGKTILRIPPHIASQLNSIAKPNASVAYTGTKKPINPGEVSAGDYAVIHCRTLTLNGRQYLVQ